MRGRRDDRDLQDEIQIDGHNSIPNHNVEKSHDSLQLRRSVLLAMVIFAPGPVCAADVAEIDTLLKHEIIGPDLSMTEVQWYCDERVPAMPTVTTVEQWEQEAERIRAAVLDRIVYRGEAARLARRGDESRVARHDRWRAGLSHPQVALRSAARSVDSGVAVRTREPDGQGARQS